MISQQTQQQQQHVLQLSPYNHHIQPLAHLGSGSSSGHCNSTIITTAASASSSPSCTSPPLQTQQLPAISSVINGLSSHHNGSATGVGGIGGGGVTVTTAPYHQLAIIASPIVITSTHLDNSAELGAQGVALQSLGGSINSGRVAATTLGSGICPSTYKTRNATATVMHHPSALAYATNAYVIGTGPGASSCATTSLSGLEQTIDGSPLLSFSEVTNTLLNQ